MVNFANAKIISEHKTLAGKTIEYSMPSHDARSYAEEMSGHSASRSGTITKKDATTDTKGSALPSAGGGDAAFSPKPNTDETPTPTSALTGSAMDGSKTLENGDSIVTQNDIVNNVSATGLINEKYYTKDIQNEMKVLNNTSGVDKSVETIMSRVFPDSFIGPKLEGDTGSLVVSAASKEEGVTINNATDLKAFYAANPNKELIVKSPDGNLFKLPSSLNTWSGVRDLKNLNKDINVERYYIQYIDNYGRALDKVVTDFKHMGPNFQNLFTKQVMAILGAVFGASVVTATVLTAIILTNKDDHRTSGE